ncbi:MAG: carboxypeptidase-like regulatory domain-containing protein, partial [Brevinematales bacterium]
MRGIYRLLILGLFILPMVMWGRSLYYYEDFSSAQSVVESRGWIFNFPMSRDMIIYDIYNDWGSAAADDINYPKTNYLDTGRLKIMGQPNNIALFWNNWFSGNGVKFDPKLNSSFGQINTSEEEPFGYTIIRYTTSIDARGNYSERVGVYVDAINQTAYISTWLVSDNGVTKNDTNARWNDFVFFYDKGRIQANNNIWGYDKNNVDWDVPFSTLTADIDGNNPGTLTTFFEKQYDDQAQPHFNSEAGGYTRPVTDELAINMIHSGNKILIYINPNPAGDGGPQNTWIKFAEVPVAWSNDIIAFIGNEINFFRGEPVEAQFDNFLIRTIASNVVAKVTPQKVMTNSSVEFAVEIEPQGVATEDSGIGEIYIKKPAGYGSWQLNTVTVSNSYSTSLSRITSGTPGAGQFLVQEKNGELYIRFQMASSSANQIVRNGKILVKFTLQTPSTPNGVGDDFAVYVDCRKHVDTAIDYIFNNSTGIKYATTGRKKAYPVSSDDLKVKVYTAPVAYAYIQSAPMIVGQEVQNVTVRVDGSGIVGSPDISSLRIEIPSDFIVSNNNPALGITNIVSTKVLLNKSISNIYLTNIAGKNYIFVDYMPNGFDGVYGFDMINFNVYGTPVLPGGMFYSNYHWHIDAESSGFVMGANWATVDTPNSYIRVVASNANAVAYLTPTKVSINANIALNTNTYTYTFKNVGNTGNNIYAIRILVPGNFDTIENVTSLSGGSAAYSNGFIWVNYGATPITSGQTASLTFKARHTNTDVYSAGEIASFIMYADNSNSMGYVEQTEDSPKTWKVNIAPPLPSGENKLEPAIVYTTAVTNEITNTIVNLSPRDIDIRMVRIDFNTNYFTNIISVNSLLIGNNYTLVTNDSNYSIYLNYQNNGTNLPSWYKDNNSVDKVVIRFVDKISYDTFSSMPTNLSIPTYLYKVNYETSDPNFYALSAKKSDGTNVLWIEYPPVDIVSYISPSVIDTTSITNNISIYITNMGAPGNRIHKINIPVDNTISTEIFDAVLTGGGAVVFNSISNRIELSFPTPFDGGEGRVLTFKMVDLVENENKYNVGFLPSVSNDRGWKYNITEGSPYVNFVLPKPKGGGGSVPAVVYIGNGTSVITQTIDFYITNTGIGSDNFQAVKIDFPKFLEGDLITVYSTKHNLYNTNSSGIFTITPSNIIINYTNNKILAGEQDLLKFTFAVGGKSLPTNGEWNVYAHNGFVDMGTVPPSYFFELTNVNNWNKKMYATKPLSYYISDNAYTTDPEKQFEITIKNGDVGNVPVKRIGISIPWPFSIENISSDVIISGYPGTKSIATNWLWIDYATPLPENQTTIVRIKAKKELLTDITNVSWKPVFVYTNDVVTFMHTNIIGSDVMYILLPDMNYYAYVSPNNVSRDEQSIDYKFIITNLGENLNNIYRVKITPPLSNQIITNIQVLSKRLKSHSVYSNDGSLYIDYYISNTNISSLDYDEINIRGYDNQDVEGFSGLWKVEAINSKTGAAVVQSKNPLDIGKSLEMKFIIPPYNSQYAILDKELDTLKNKNTLRVNVANTGEAGNDILGVRIYLPWPFITNNISMLSLKGGYLSKIDNDGTNYIEIGYDAGIFTNNVNDTISLDIYDNFGVGETNINIFVKTKYSTSAGKFIDSKWPGGDTNLVSFKMPYPDLRADLMPNEVYNNQPLMELNIRLINNGATYNNITSLQIEIPAPFTNDFDTSKAIDPLATSKSYSDGILTLNYDSFTSKTTNYLILRLTNTITNAGNSYNFNMLVNNGARISNTYGTNNLVITRGPAGNIQSAYIDLKSTFITNTVVVEIDNGVASGNSGLQYARFVIPDVFTNIVSGTSSKGVVVSNELTNFVIYYENGLAKGDKDIVTFDLIDKYDMHKTNGIKWELYVNNGSGYAKANETFSALLQSMSIPKINVSNLNNSQSFFAKTITNTLLVFLTNVSEGNNYAYSNVIELHPTLNNLIDYSNSYTGSSISYNSSQAKVYITYPTGFKVGEVDKIYLIWTNNFTIGDYNYFVKSYNGSDEGPNVIQTLVTIKNDSEQAEAYLKPKNQILYSIDNDGDVALFINNKMLDKGIKDVRISLDTSILKIKSVYSSNLNKNLSYITSLTDVVVNYGVDEIKKLSNDILILSLTYTNNMNWTNRLETWVRYDGGELFYETKVSSGETIDLPVLLADFGRITGIVLPGAIKPQVSLIGSDGKVATNRNGEKAIASANVDGSYKVDFVVPGTYRVQFSGTGYATNNIIDGISAEANKITNIGLYKMKKAIFTPSSPV